MKYRAAATITARLASDTSACAGRHYFSSRDSEEKARSPGPKQTAGSPAAPLEASRKIRSQPDGAPHHATPRPQVSVAGETEFQADFSSFVLRPQLFSLLIFGRFSAPPGFVSLPLAHRNLTLALPTPEFVGATFWDTVFPSIPHARLRLHATPNQSLRQHLDRKNRLDLLLGSLRGARAKTASSLLEKGLGLLGKKAILHDPSNASTRNSRASPRIDIMLMGPRP